MGSQKEKWEKKKLEMIEAAEASFLENLQKNPANDEEYNELDSPSERKKKVPKEQEQEGKEE